MKKRLRYFEIRLGRRIRYGSAFSSKHAPMAGLFCIQASAIKSLEEATTIPYSLPGLFPIRDKRTKRMLRRQDVFR